MPSMPVRVIPLDLTILMPAIAALAVKTYKRTRQINFLPTILQKIKNYPFLLHCVLKSNTLGEEMLQLSSTLLIQQLLFPNPNVPPATRRRRRRLYGRPVHT
jgi:hypothetical protein